MRLWLFSVVVCLAALVAMGYGLAGHSLWPAVGLFCVASALAWASSRTDVVNASAVRLAVEALTAERDTMMKVINDHAADIDHLKRKDALSQVG